jgi:hypothetical protein
LPLRRSLRRRAVQTRPDESVVVTVVVVPVTEPSADLAGNQLRDVPALTARPKARPGQRSGLENTPNRAVAPPAGTNA